ncbi:MAG TPA: hypothetical protein VKV80_21350 [Streptosporangiaceae bacterium]|nr:hypothetical protein [Streptosporangiaceae bacterium]
MRYRVTFFAGFAIGFVLGTRAGRERYEQMERAARSVAGNPAVRQAAGSVIAGITRLVTMGKEKAASTMPGIAETARHKAGGRFDRIPGLRGGGATSGGHDGPPGQRFAPSPGSTHGSPDGT